jgi:ribosomal protein S18 acetylase RimI-like enzyme
MVRPARPAEAAEIGLLYRKEAEQHAASAPGLDLEPGFDWAALVSNLIGSRDAVLLVAVDGEDIIGFIFLRIRGDAAIEPARSTTRGALRAALRRLMGGQRGAGPSDPGQARRVRPFAVIEDCYVVEAARRRGAGRLLVEAGLAWVKDRGLERVALSVVADNGPAEAFWKALGFETYRVNMDLRLEGS